MAGDTEIEKLKKGYKAIGRTYHHLIGRLYKIKTRKIRSQY